MKYDYFLAPGVCEDRPGIYEWRILELVNGQLELAQSLPSSCTFEGMRWSSNVVQHENWCNRNPASRQATEDAARRKELAACMAKSP